MCGGGIYFLIYFFCISLLSTFPLQQPYCFFLTNFVAYSYVIVVEHDLSVLDYLSDFVCCLYGTPGAYGVVTMPFSVREGMFVLAHSYKKI